MPSTRSTTSRSGRGKGAAPTPAAGHGAQDVAALLAGAGAVLLGMALVSYDGQADTNWVGPVGRAIAGSLAEAFGWAAAIPALEAALFAVRVVTRRRSPLGWALAPALLAELLIASAFLHLVLGGAGGARAFGAHPAGGLLGELLGEVARALLGYPGAVVVVTTLGATTLLLRTRLSLRALVGRLGDLGAAVAAWLRGAATALAEAWREAKALDEAERAASAPRVTGLSGAGDTAGDTRTPRSGPRPTTRGGDAAPASEDLVHDGDTDDEDAHDDRSALGTGVGAAAAGAAADQETGPGETGPGEMGPGDAGAGATRPEDRGAVRPALRPRPRDAGPRIVPPRPEAVPASSSPSTAGGIPAPALGEDFRLPPTSLLDVPPPSGVAIDAGRLRENADRLVEKLAAYGVAGRVDEIHPGPVVTLYEFEPKSGTKIAKIAGLADDLAMALAAQKVRIVAPIPGKARVGFELPNDTRQIVYLRQVLEDERWRRTGGSLPVAYGKDISGQPVYGDLAKMPHLLIAGATGMGKSVGLNVLLCSLLQKKTPEEVRLLMIDPKMVELAVFDGIPHMLLPVVTDMRKAALALRWAVDEMERRYQLFADAGARNVLTYNERVQKVRDGALDPAAFNRRKPKPRGADAQESLALDAPVPEKLPHVVVVVDEFADLMMVAAKDVEACVARLAQKARAAGIHVVLATQRPSVDVITGMIKANFPARIGYKVTQREDSKTILGRSGAEHLLGMGDMLMMLPGSGDLRRVHSAFVSEDEVRRICDHLREQGDPVYDENILRPRDDEEGDGAGEAGGGSDDPLYDRAVAVVAQAGYCSISHIQRQLGVGYNKAAKLVEQMEAEGVVGPPTGKAGGRREVFVNAL